MVALAFLGLSRTGAAQTETQTQPQAPVVSSEDPRPAAEAPEASRGMHAFWNDGLTIESADAQYQVRIGTLVRLDGRFVPRGAPDGALTDTLTMRTVRATIQGRITKYFVFRMVPDFTSTASFLADAFIDIGLSNAVHVRIGRDKTPTGFEALLGDANVLFMDRGVTLNLMPGRDVGVQIYGDLAGRTVSYAAGMFNGVADGMTAGNIDTDNGKEFVGRVVIRPFSSSRVPFLQKLGIGVAGTREMQRGALPAFRTAGQQPYFSYVSGLVADGLHTRFSPQTFHYYKSFSAYTEYVRSRQVVRGGRVMAPATNNAWQVASSFLLTGETAGERVRPKRAFDPEHHTWGAVQVMARYGSMTLDRGTFERQWADAAASQQVQIATAGTIWFLTTNVKATFNVDRTVFDRGRIGAREPELDVAFRVQLNF